ncbi:hypothetical protein HanIR_Chr10g0472421 [Helianthus annuus]|nr:hypothetical protein HanIR_Chr10g0472421 [Helianthus annuus]
MATRSLEILKAVAVRGGLVSRTLEDGEVVRMKILIKRRDLEQVIKKSYNNKENRDKGYNHRQLSRSMASKSLKAPVNDTVKVTRANSDPVKVDCRSHWRPALQSIPEEF